MGKRKKSSNELDAILEQLKRSYGSELDSELEDSLLEDEHSEEDEELSSVLAKIFSDFEEEADNAISAMDSDADTKKEDIAQDTDNITAPTDQAVLTQPSVINTTEDGQDDQYPINSNEYGLPRTQKNTANTEKEAVDGVLNAMLHRDVTAEKDIDSPEPTVDLHKEKPQEQTDIQLEPQPVAISVHDCCDDASCDNDSVIDMGDECYVEDVPVAEYTEDERTELTPDTLILDGECEQRKTADRMPEPPKPIIVLDHSQYTNDPLQLALNDLCLLKLEEDISEIQIQEKKEKPSENHSESCPFDSNDVSLLVKFGYGEEVNAQIGRDKVKNLVFENEKTYIPEQHKVPFGFIGKEYSSRKQDDEIRQKYKNDRFALVVSLIAISAFTLISFILGLMFEFSSQKLDYYVGIMTLDFLLVAISALVCGKRLFFGAIGISRFESNTYSVLLLFAAEYLIYNVVASVIYAIDPILLYNSFCWISGSCVLAYFAAVTLCDLLDCDKQYKTFELMTGSPKFYTAEKLSPSDESNETSRVKGQHVGTSSETFRVRKTSMIGGYFKKISESGIKTVKPVYALGIVPSIALALSCCVAIVCENAVYGVHTFIITSILCIPVSCLSLGTINGYINAKHHRKDNAAFIGSDNEIEYAKASMLVFDDTESVEITSYKEINPGKNSGDIQKKLLTAYNVFNTLGGPLGEIVPDRYVSLEGHELVINSIADNGINIYFDSTTNILIGDKQYMLMHGLKVKTDVNLTTATKGSDRYVIYMAFDGKPQLGFVLTQKIKSDFAKIASILADSRIAMTVESYEPEVNELYFEQNKSSDYSVINIHKPPRYQRKTSDAVCDGTLIAQNALSLSKAISKCTNEPARKKNINRANLISFMIGGVCAALMAVIMCIDNSKGVLGILNSHPYIAFSIAIIVGTIPAIINAIKEYTRK